MIPMLESLTFLPVLGIEIVNFWSIVWTHVQRDVGVAAAPQTLLTIFLRFLLMSPTHSEHTIRYVTNGTRGRNGANGVDGNYGGQRGQNGARGEDGHHAGALKIKLSTDGTKVFCDRNGEIKQFPLSHRTASVFLEARGGDAGHGGVGGDGGKGLTGARGANATRYSWGQNGGPGHQGGTGGAGGAGGNGGSGGNVTITVARSDTDLLMLTNIPDLRGGAKGKGGKGGSGGPGGDGGPGGRGYFYTTTSTGADGKSSTTVNYNPGGWDGPQGPWGRDGRNGNDGFCGNDGLFRIKVGSNCYGGPYDLSVTSSKLFEKRTDDGIFEPGKTILVEMMVKNTGEMPTPEQPIRMSLQDTKWVSFDPRTVFTLPVGIVPNRTISCSENLEYTINKPVATPTGEPLNEVGTIDYRATVGRVERQFSAVTEQVKTFIIKYPAELKAVDGVRAIRADEEALLSVQVDNISRKALGLRGCQQRLTNLYLKAVDTDDGQAMPTDVTFFDREGARLSGSQGLSKPIDQLPSKGHDRLSGSLKFSNPALSLYSKVTIHAELELGCLESPSDQQSAITVHKRVFQTQLAEGYKFNPNADFLLVTNANTSLVEWNQWQVLAGQFGLKFTTWNSSLYNGISLFREQSPKAAEERPTGAAAAEIDQSPSLPPSDEDAGAAALLPSDEDAGAAALLPSDEDAGAAGLPPSYEEANAGLPPSYEDVSAAALPPPYVDANAALVDHFKYKTIVFLNNDDTSVDSLPYCDLFKAACNGVKTYIVGPREVDPKLFYPEEGLAESLGERAKKTVVKNYFRSANISVAKLAKEAEIKAEKLRKEWPEKKFTVVYEHDVQNLPRKRLPILGDYGRKRVQLGTLTSVNSPMNNMFVQLSKQPSQEDRSDYVLDPSNVYGLLKSLSMEKKIQMIQSVNADNRHDWETLAQVILSDLVDEHEVFSQDRWTGSIGERELKKRLTCLRQILDANYPSLHSKEMVKGILIEFRAFVARLPKFRDHCPKRRQSLLASVTKDLIDSFKKQMEFDREDWRKTYKSKKLWFKNLGRRELWDNYRDPSVVPAGYGGVNPVLKSSELRGINDGRVFRIAENRHHFRNQEERLRALEALENANNT